MKEEKRLISDCIKGKPKAQKKLYETYASLMYTVCLRYSKTNFEAEDIMQESFVKVFENLHRFKGECRLQFWIKRIVINTALKANRRKMDQAPKEDIDTLYDQPSEDLILSDYNYREILSFIKQLAPRYQVIFNLYAIEGYKHREIAEMLDISEGTSKSQYSRAKSILQKIIEKENKINYEKAGQAA